MGKCCCCDEDDKGWFGLDLDPKQMIIIIVAVLILAQCFMAPPRQRRILVRHYS